MRQINLENTQLKKLKLLELFFTALISVDIFIFLDFSYCMSIHSSSFRLFNMQFFYLNNLGFTGSDCYLHALRLLFTKWQIHCSFKFKFIHLLNWLSNKDTDLLFDK